MKRVGKTSGYAMTLNRRQCCGCRHYETVNVHSAVFPYSKPNFAKKTFTGSTVFAIKYVPPIADPCCVSYPDPCYGIYPDPCCVAYSFDMLQSSNYVVQYQCGVNVTSSMSGVDIECMSAKAKVAVDNRLTIDAVDNGFTIQLVDNRLTIDAGAGESGFKKAVEQAEQENAYGAYKPFDVAAAENKFFKNFVVNIFLSFYQNQKMVQDLVIIEDAVTYKNVFAIFNSIYNYKKGNRCRKKGAKTEFACHAIDAEAMLGGAEAKFAWYAKNSIEQDFGCKSAIPLPGVGIMLNRCKFLFGFTGNYIDAVGVILNGWYVYGTKSYIYVGFVNNADAKGGENNG